MRRLVVVLLCLGICLSVPARVQAVNNQRRVKGKPQKGRAPVKPLNRRRPSSGRRSIGETRTASIDQQYADMVAERENDAPDEEYEPEPPIRMGRVAGMRNHHRPDGRFAPTAPGYGEFERFVGGKAGRYGIVATVFTGVAAVVIGVFAFSLIGAAAGHNIPQLFDFFLGGR